MSNKFRKLENFLALLDGVKQSGTGYIALCPAHDDTNPSLSVSMKNNRILVKCFAGCKTKDIVKALGLKLNDLFLDDNAANSKMDITSGNSGYTVIPSSEQVQNTVTATELHSVTGVTLESLAESKNLPPDFPKSLGLSDSKYNGKAAVRIPYYTEDGTEASVRFRLELTGGNRFRWYKGSHPMLYGLDKLEEIRKLGWVLLVEGESDCWAIWLHHLPALGIPGKSTWQSEWTEHLSGLKVFIWQEPDAEDLVLKVMADIHDLSVIQAPEGIKDISDAHIQGKDFPVYLEELKGKAVPAEMIRSQHKSKELSELYVRAKDVIESADPIENVKEAIRNLGYGGDIKPAILVYLAATSRLLKMQLGTMPFNLVLLGPSSSGKNYTISVVKELLPTDAYHEIDSGSERNLIYDEASLQHKLLIFGEADNLPSGEDNTAASAMRNLLQDHHLHYRVTERDPHSGKYKVREIKKAGPTVLITTSTKPLGEQLATRLFTVEMRDDRNQIIAALEAQAKLETENLPAIPENLVAFQSWLQQQAPSQAVVPFTKGLVRGITNSNCSARTLRDYAKIISLIKTVAIIRQHNRKRDTAGKIIALPEDYDTVRELLNDVYVATVSVSKEVRSLVDAVDTLSKKSSGKDISGSELVEYLGINKMAVSRRARVAIKQGWLVNNEQLRGHPAKYALGEAMPREEVLPTAKEIENDGNSITNYNEQNVTPSSIENKECNGITPFSDGNISNNQPQKAGGNDELHDENSEDDDEYGDLF